ncbi:MAG TPA: hypothetical protein VGJ26_12585 [Pirellulales bacterium]|jgi:hypothetical protein
MKTEQSWYLPCLAIAIVVFCSSAAQATIIVFDVDPTGTYTGLPAIAPTTANQGQYNAGSWLTISGSLSMPLSGGEVATSKVTAEKAPSGSFSTGNPGSLTSFLGGELWTEIDLKNGTISFPGESDVTAGNYNTLYPEHSTASFPLSPAIGGGVSTAAPGSDPANFGIAIALKALGILTVASGSAAERDGVYDIQQLSPATSEQLISSGAELKFDTNGLIGLAATSGNLDYNLKGSAGLGSPIPDMIGSTSISSSDYAPSVAGQGTLTTMSYPEGVLALYLTLPIHTTIVETIPGATPITMTLTLDGQISAHAIIFMPEPGTATLLGTGAVGLFVASFRRWRRRTVG